MNLAAGVYPDPLRNYSAPSDPLSVIRRRGGGREWERKGWK